MQFEAEIIRTSQRKLVSNDNQYEIVFRTTNPQILDLGKLPSETILTIKATLHDTPKPESNKENEVGHKI